MQRNETRRIQKKAVGFVSQHRPCFMKCQNHKLEQEVCTMSDAENWYEQDTDAEDDYYPIEEYDITASPNDFNIKTIFDFIESGVVEFPGFQRNYVWDLGRASRLIESVIIGLPVPQIFLYQKSRNHFLVIDGQQRLMTIYYFIKEFFPKMQKRSALRTVFAEHGSIPDSFLNDDEYFEKFCLKLPERLPSRPNRLNRLMYSTLPDEYKSSFDLRTIRNVVIRQNMPQDDDSSIYEIFSRLNSGGVNLKAQEIRASLYHSDFYTMLQKINSAPQWRDLLGLPDPDIHMKDIEFLLRGFAMLIEGESYKPSMAKFLNNFSKNSAAFTREKISSLENLFYSFLEACSSLPDRSFMKSGKFNVSLYEAVFAAVCGTETETKIDPAKLEILKADTQFLDASHSSTTNKANVEKRLVRARSIMLG
jgi:uncharacterized protein with ParB-like and HNH nuclease domain